MEFQLEMTLEHQSQWEWKLEHLLVFPLEMKLEH